ncbi:acyl carrier protein [Clostridium sp. ATCC BAA-442]|jgi:acyl carrier protein|nr:acyl carrier protein [Flavonifractor plautii ATCC 29863]ERI68412.1 acyl carrier protein [Clostridium sp. ATCC BAA-442]
MNMIFEKLAALLSEQFGVDVDSITMDTSFEDLGADSLDIVEMTMAVEEEFGLEDMDEEDLSGISTVADLVRYLKSKLED